MLRNEVVLFRNPSARSRVFRRVDYEPLFSVATGLIWNEVSKATVRKRRIVFYDCSPRC